VTGYYADPINQGTSYDDELPPTRSEREAYFATSHASMFLFRLKSPQVGMMDQR
jgi:hypothetical protein